MSTAVRLWTCALNLQGVSTFGQVRASTPEAALVAFLSQKPFLRALGRGSGWPEDPADHEVVEIAPSEVFVGVYECGLLNDSGENALIMLVDTVDQGWELSEGDET